MAFLTDIWDLLGHQAKMATAVRLMANSTIFFNRGMLPDEWTAFIRMAAVAKQIDRLGKQKICIDGAMRIVAIAAADLLLDYRMMGALIGSEPNLGVAAETG